MYYSLLRDEFKIHGTHNSLKNHQFLELKRIKEALDSGNIFYNKWLDESPIQELPKSLDIRIKQKELIRKIHTQGLEQLKNLLNDDIYLYDIEYPCKPYGFVDMVYMGRDTIYPIEIKRSRGEHDLIGQITKYDLYHRLQLHYKHYEHVKSMTICNSYQPFVIRELKKMGILTLNYFLTKNGIRINEYCYNKNNE